MQITEIRIKLMESSEDRLRAFCSITIDSCFVVRDLKIIDGANGPFVAMPSRKLTGHCQRCHHKNHLRANYCNHCGNKLSFESEGPLDSPQKLYADVAHPINSECRELIQDAVIAEFDTELKRCQQPGYRSRYDDDFMDAGEDVDAALIDPPHLMPAPPRQRTAAPERAASERTAAERFTAVHEPQVRGMSTSGPSPVKPGGGGEPSGGGGDGQNAGPSDGFGAGIF